MARQSITDADAWVDAAYARFRAEGLGGIRIEALARDLGATKGSFYWHFGDRHALVVAVVERWERDETDSYMEAATHVDPRRRIEELVSVVGRRRPPGEDRLYMAAVAEGVDGIVERVTRRRIRFIADALIEHGVAPDDVEQRALIALTSTLGIEQLAQGGAASVFPKRGALGAALLDYLFSAGARRPPRPR